MTAISMYLLVDSLGINRAATGETHDVHAHMGTCKHASVSHIQHAEKRKGRDLILHQDDYAQSTVPVSTS